MVLVIRPFLVRRITARFVTKLNDHLLLDLQNIVGQSPGDFPCILIENEHAGPKLLDHHKFDGLRCQKENARQIQQLVSIGSTCPA